MTLFWPIIETVAAIALYAFRCLLFLGRCTYHTFCTSSLKVPGNNTVSTGSKQTWSFLLNQSLIINKFIIQSLPIELKPHLVRPFFSPALFLYFLLFSPLFVESLLSCAVTSVPSPSPIKPSSLVEISKELVVHCRIHCNLNTSTSIDRTGQWCSAYLASVVLNKSGPTGEEGRGRCSSDIRRWSFPLLEDARLRGRSHPI